MAIHKDARNLSDDEKRNFVEAVKAIKATGQYDQYVVLHDEAMTRGTPSSVPSFERNAAHRGPAFSPWHREFLRRFELDLQAASGDPTLGVPYWNWAADAADPAASIIWGDDLMGGNGDPNDSNAVKTGPFAYDPSDSDTWTVVDARGEAAGGLRRGFASFTLATQADVEATL